MALMTKFCPDCGSCPNVQVMPAEEKCPDCGKENLQSVFELACAVEDLKKIISDTAASINTMAMQRYDIQLEKIAIKLRKQAQ